MTKIVGHNFLEKLARHICDMRPTGICHRDQHESYTTAQDRKAIFKLIFILQFLVIFNNTCDKICDA